MLVAPSRNGAAAGLSLPDAPAHDFVIMGRISYQGITA
jgi:hypothetical protein